MLMITAGCSMQPYFDVYIFSLCQASEVQNIIELVPANNEAISTNAKRKIRKKRLGSSWNLALLLLGIYIYIHSDIID